MSAIPCSDSPQDCRSVGVSYVKAWVLEYVLLKVLHKRDGVSMLDVSGHKVLLPYISKFIINATQYGVLNGCKVHPAGESFLAHAISRRPEFL